MYCCAQSHQSEEGRGSAAERRQLAPPPPRLARATLKCKSLTENSTYPLPLVIPPILSGRSPTLGGGAVMK